MNKKRLIIGWSLFAILWPLTLAGFVCKFFYNYFEGGIILYDRVDELLEKWLDK